MAGRVCPRRGHRGRPLNSAVRLRRSVVDLAIIEPGKYFASGSYGVSESAIGMPLEASFSVESLPNNLVIEGTWQQHSGRPTYTFRVEFARDQQSQSQAQVIVAAFGVGRLGGRISLRGPTLELLAADAATKSSLSARLVPMEKPRIYEISGAVALNGEVWFPFHLRVVPTETREALSNVVRISAGKLHGAI